MPGKIGRPPKVEKNESNVPDTLKQELASLKKENIKLKETLKEKEKPKSEKDLIRERVPLMSKEQLIEKEKELAEIISEDILAESVYRGSTAAVGRHEASFWKKHKNHIREWQEIRRKRFPDVIGAADYRMHIKPIKKD